MKELQNAMLMPWMVAIATYCDWLHVFVLGPMATYHHNNSVKERRDTVERLGKQ